MKTQVRIGVLPVLLLFLFLGAGCAPAAEPDRWATVQEESSGQAATSGEAVAGGEFNRYFPEAQEGYDIVYTQEISGFGVASLQYEGEEIATLAITHVANNPEMADKYADSPESLDDYPLAEVGSEGTAILVADRFQVQVRSKQDDFDASDRETWLRRLDLDGLASLAD
jgi:hypothetical protein